MKYFVFFLVILGSSFLAYSQKNYPEPEFSNEVYYLKKDSILSLVRLEKGSSKMETKTKAGGFGGFENGYILEGEKSTTRFASGKDLSFVFSNGSSARAPSPQTDSMMRANGVDPAMMESMGGMSDPANTISLYKADAGKDKRKILLQKAPGAFGGKKMQSSDKFTFSVKKIKAGYWELVIDKPLSKGEYAFTMMNMGSANMDGSILLFAFAID